MNLEDLPKGQKIQVRVQVQDPQNEIIYSSRPIEVETKIPCLVPTNFPQGLQGKSIGPNQVQILWRPLPKSEWNCEKVFYELKFSTPTTQGYRNFTYEKSSTDFESLPFTEWILQIRAVTPAGSGPWSPQIKITTLESDPGPVLNLQVNPMGPDSIRTNWQPPANPNGIITGYEVSYQLMNRGMCGADLPEREYTEFTRDTTYIIRELFPHSKYRVKIRAKTNGVGEEVVGFASTEQAAPTAPPRNLKGENIQAQRATLIWQGPPCLETNGEITKYEFEFVGLDPWAIDDRRILTALDTKANVENLIPFTKYQTKVRAFTAKGPGPWSEIIEIITDSAETPPAPIGLKLVDTQAESVTLLFQSPTPPHGQIDQYKLHFAPGGTGQWKETVYRKDQLRCRPEIEKQQRVQLPKDAEIFCVEIRDLIPSKFYDFQVAAHISNKNWGPWSNLVTARTGDEAPIPILSLELLTATETSLEFRWEISPEHHHRVDQYRV